MFKLDPQGSYMMPAHFGPRPFSPKSSGWYRDVTSMTVAFVTEREALAAYLPAPYRVADIPVVTITYACNRQVDWLAGHGYNLVAVNAAAVFEGEDETGEVILYTVTNIADGKVVVDGNHPWAGQRIIFKAIEKNMGNYSNAAKDLGVPRKTLYNKMKKYGLE